MLPRYLCVRRNADGGERYYWRPSERLQRLGFSLKALSRNRADAFAQAEEINRMLPNIAHSKVLTPRSLVASAAKPPMAGRLHAAARLTTPLLMRWSVELEKPTLTPSVYVVVADNGWVKIGTARKPLKRLERLSTANPLSLNLYFALRLPEKLARVIETRAHRRLQNFKLRGEWFEVHPLYAVCVVLEEVGGLAVKGS